MITTIHGFCSHLLREYPVEAKLDPQFVQLDAHRAAMLLDAAVEETLTDLINAGHEPILRLTAGVGRGKLAANLSPHGGRLGLPADFLIAPDGRVMAAKYGEHADDQWSVDEMLALAR